MKLKDITANCQTEIQHLKENSPWENPKVKIYESKTSRFVHECIETGQVISISRGGGYVTQKEIAFAIVKLMKLIPADVVIYSNPNGILFIKEKDETYYEESSSYH